MRQQWVVGLVALLVATAGWSTVDAQARPGDPIERIVTLGDSYSSGAGIHRHAFQYDDHGPAGHSFGPSTRLGASTCYRMTERTPGAKLAAELGIPSTLVACAGATIADLANQLDAAHLERAGAGSVVVLTIGGNDVRSARGEGWADVLARCVTTFGCDHHPNEAAGLDELEDRLASAFTMLGEQVPAARVRVLAYPRLMQPGRWSCLGVVGIGRAEASWIDRQVDALNAAIERAVQRAASVVEADLRFVSVVKQFEGHGACRGRASDRWVNTTVLGQTYVRRMAGGVITHHYRDDLVNFSSASFHPSQRGYDAYLAALRSSL